MTTRRPLESVCDVPAAKKTKIAVEKECEIHSTLHPSKIVSSESETPQLCFTESVESDVGDIPSNCFPQTTKIDLETQDEGIIDEEKRRRRCLVRCVTLEDIKNRRELPKLYYANKRDVKFFAKIEPAANERAEDELRRALSQAAFRDMEVGCRV